MASLTTDNTPTVDSVSTEEPYLTIFDVLNRDVSLTFLGLFPVAGVTCNLGLAGVISYSYVTQPRTRMRAKLLPMLLCCLVHTGFLLGIEGDLFSKVALNDWRTATCGWNLARVIAHHALTSLPPLLVAATLLTQLMRVQAWVTVTRTARMAVTGAVVAVCVLYSLVVVVAVYMEVVVYDRAEPCDEDRYVRQTRAGWQKVLIVTDICPVVVISTAFLLLLAAHLTTRNTSPPKPPTARACGGGGGGAGDVERGQRGATYRLLPSSPPTHSTGCDKQLSHSPFTLHVHEVLLGNGSDKEDGAQKGNGSDIEYSAQKVNGARKVNGSDEGDGAQKGNGSIPGDGAQKGNGSIPGDGAQKGNGSIPGDGAQKGNGSIPGDGAQKGNGSIPGDGAQKGNGSDKEDGAQKVNGSDTGDGADKEDDSDKGESSDKLRSQSPLSPLRDYHHLSAGSGQGKAARGEGSPTPSLQASTARGTDRGCPLDDHQPPIRSLDEDHQPSTRSLDEDHRPLIRFWDKEQRPAVKPLDRVYYLQAIKAVNRYLHYRYQNCFTPPLEGPIWREYREEEEVREEEGEEEREEEEEGEEEEEEGGYVSMASSSPLLCAAFLSVLVSLAYVVLTVLLGTPFLGPWEVPYDDTLFAYLKASVVFLHMMPMLLVPICWMLDRDVRALICRCWKKALSCRCRKKALNCRWWKRSPSYTW